MNIINLQDGFHVQAAAIMTLQAATEMTAKAPNDIQLEWLGDSPEEQYPLKRFIPTIKAVLFDRREVMLYFGSEDARNRRLAELIKQWQQA